MGLFKFLKKKNTITGRAAPAEEKNVATKTEAPVEGVAVKKADKDTKPITDKSNMPTEDNMPPTDTAENQPNQTYFGDLEKTGILVDLCSVPHERRDDRWFHEFMENLPLASFRTTEQQVLTGPDGFPYLHLELPEPGVQFQCYVIDNMVYDFLLTNGLGVAINPSKEQPDWVLTYGDIFNYAIKKDFYNKDNTYFNTSGENQLVPTEMDNNVMVGQPSEFILPAPARAVMRSFLEYKQVKDPKVLLMTTTTPEGREAQDLVFNLTPGDFASEEAFRATAQQLQWFLPRHYSLAFFGENESLKDYFSPL